MQDLALLQHEEMTIGHLALMEGSTNRFIEAERFCVIAAGPPDELYSAR